MECSGLRSLRRLRGGMYVLVNQNNNLLLLDHYLLDRHSPNCLVLLSFFIPFLLQIDCGRTVEYLRYVLVGACYCKIASRILHPQ